MGCTNRTNGKRAGGLPVIRHRNQPSLRLISLSKAEISILVSLTVLPERLSSQVKFQMLCLPVYPLTLQNLKIPFLGSFCIQKQSACSILVLHLQLFHALIFHRIHHAIQPKRIIRHNHNDRHILQFIILSPGPQPFPQSPLLSPAPYTHPAWRRADQNQHRKTLSVRSLTDA